MQNYEMEIYMFDLICSIVSVFTVSYHYHLTPSYNNYYFPFLGYTIILQPAGSNGVILSHNLLLGLAFSLFPLGQLQKFV